jgi:hypothetical protein
MAGVFGVAKLEWNGAECLSAIKKTCRAANKEGAKAVLSKAKALRATDLQNISGDLDRALDVKESKFNDTDFIVGIFAEITPEWKDSLGARGIFVEFGHAAPHLGRGNVTPRSKIVKAVPPHPFLRPALDASGGDIRSSYHNKLK